uniref:Transglutaminase-like domain-containing protein n=1 Tax=Magallana gigas TaxID=29159 RepID=A0A8W8JJ74_MAGGI
MDDLESEDNTTANQNEQDLANCEDNNVKSNPLNLDCCNSASTIKSFFNRRPTEFFFGAIAGCVFTLIVGKTALYYLAAVAIVYLVALFLGSGSHNKLGVFERIKSTIFPTLFDKIWNFFAFSLGVLVLGGFVLWGPLLMPFLIGKSFLFYFSSLAVAFLGMAAMNLVGQRGEEEININSVSPPSPEPFPPPSPEILSPDGALPDNRQQEVHSQFAISQDQASQELTSGRETVHMPSPEKAVLANATLSKPIQVEMRCVGQQPPAAPSTFELVPVRTEQEKSLTKHEVAPPPSPGNLKLSLDQVDCQILHSIEEHAIQVSKSEHPSFRELVWDLIFSKHISNELEKVIAIFRWLATKNLKEMIFDNVEKGSPEEILLGLKEGKTTYAKVFDTMCNHAGLHSRIISGYAKGVNYKPGMKFNPGKNQHNWNAVYINGTWGLVDADWAAREIIKKLWKLRYRLDEHFFLPDPHHFICDHFPDEDQWQLLERPIALEEFENMPHILPDFFKYGLEFVSHRTVIIYGRGEINIRLRYVANKWAEEFNFRLQFESNEEEEYKGTKLNRYGMQESVGGIVNFRLRLPVEGSYILTIYAKEDTPENKENVYHPVCEYKIVQEEVSVTEPTPFPPCAYLNWGTGTFFSRYGLATYQKTAKILTKDGRAELQIIIPKQMQFMTKLKHNDRNDADLVGYVTHRIVGNNVCFNITVPSRGEYGLEILCNDPATECSTLYQVAQYLVECNEDVKTVPLPKLPAGYLGAKLKFNDYGLNTVSHHIPVIHLETNTVEIQISVAQEMKVTANLTDMESDRELPEFVFIQTKDSVVSFIVNCPSVGFYKLQLYALPFHDSSQQLPGVYNYLINCQRKTENVYPFPKQDPRWKKSCYMWESLVVNKEIGKPTVNFHVKIPKAEDVAVVVNQEWTHLKSSTPEIWQGEVNLAPYYGEGVKVTVNANFGGDKTSYSRLLEYSI